MKNLKLISILLAFLSFTVISCDEDDAEQVIIDSALPNGTFTVQRSGSLTAQNGTPTTGTVELGSDPDGSVFLRFGDNFTTELATGTVSIYLSTSETFTPDPANGNPDLMVIGAVARNGEAFFKLNGSVDSKYTHVILWCGTANIPFGNAQLQ